MEALSRIRIPLSLVIVRYFAYALVLIAVAWLVCFAVLSAAMSAGLVYPASWGAANIDQTAQSIKADPGYDWASLPTAYRYALFSEGGTLIASDAAEAAALDHARELAASFDGGAGVEVVGASGGTYATFSFGEDEVCVLMSFYYPEFVARELRAALPNPQNLLVIAGCACSVAAVAAVACRASRVLTRKMRPLADAARAIGRQDLDFAVGSSNVRQIDDILRAVDAMRAELAASLEARWRVEQAQRDQVAALAHDLKTPLTVVRANAEFVAEEARAFEGEGSAGPAALREIAQAAGDIAEGACSLDGHVALLIEASRGGGFASVRERIAFSLIASDIERDAEALARVAGIGLEAHAEAIDGASLDADAAALRRAAMNAVSNALDHARETVRLSFGVEEGCALIEVEDDGKGFSARALGHACEHFYRDDASRSSGHYGLGLFIAAETAREHGGDLSLSNRPEGGGRVILRVPLAQQQIPADLA